MAGNQPIVPRSNPLADKMNAIAQINEQFGVRAQGGGAPLVPDEPIPAPVGSTVLPPDPVPITAEEEARLQDEFNRQWSDVAKPQVAPAPVTQSVPGLGVIPNGFAAIDLVNSQVVALNGATYPIREEERKELLTFAFRVMVRSMEEAIKKIAESIGITVQAPPAEEAAGGADGEALPEMRGNEAGQ